MRGIRFFQFFALVFCIMFLVSGCGTSKVAKQKTTIIEVQRSVVVEKTGEDNRPDWTFEKTFFEDDQGFHFSGGYMGGADETGQKFYLKYAIIV